MSEVSFSSEDIGRFADEMERRYGPGEKCDIRDFVRMFEGFIAGNPDFDVLSGYIAPLPRPQEPVSGEEDEAHEAEVQAYIQARSDANEEAGFLPIPHSVRDKFRPEAEAAIRAK
jgi:hypothetical protein